jgi:hypothetical protein
MFKPLMFSLSLAVALGICSVSKAGGYPSPQGVVASPQGYAAPCGDPCATCAPCAPKSCNFSFHCPQICLPKIHFTCPKIQCNTCYEWVLQKKHNFTFVHGSLTCEKQTCAPACPAPCAAPVYPAGQSVYPAGQGAPVGAPVYGASQQAYRGLKPAASIASAPAEMTPAGVATGEEAPPAPAAPNGGLLLPTPSGN